MKRIIYLTLIQAYSWSIMHGSGLVNALKVPARHAVSLAMHHGRSLKDSVPLVATTSDQDNYRLPDELVRNSSLLRETEGITQTDDNLPLELFSTKTLRYLTRFIEHKDSLPYIAYKDLIQVIKAHDFLDIDTARLTMSDLTVALAQHADSYQEEDLPFSLQEMLKKYALQHIYKNYKYILQDQQTKTATGLRKIPSFVPLTSKKFAQKDGISVEVVPKKKQAKIIIRKDKCILDSILLSARPKIRNVAIIGCQKKYIIIQELFGNGIIIYDIEQKRIKKTMPLPSLTFGMAADDACNFIVYGGSNNKTTICSFSTGQPVGEIKHDSMVIAAAITSDGNYVVSASRDGKAHIYSTATHQIIDTINEAFSISDIAISPDNKLLAVTRVGTITLYNLQEQKVVKKIRIPSRTTCANITNNGYIILALENNHCVPKGKILIYSLAADKFISEIDTRERIFGVGLTEEDEQFYITASGLNGKTSFFTLTIDKTVLKNASLQKALHLLKAGQTRSIIEEAAAAASE